jgi:Raf kinase inhibitor-like YbhB/YbcL family protein
LVLLFVGFFLVGCSPHDGDTMVMLLTSSAFPHQGKIPGRYTCDGANGSPPLHIEGVPDEATSLVLIMEDPDVPKNVREDGMWDHWIVWNISPLVEDIPEGYEPDGVHGKGTGGDLKYNGPCPPDREHRYFFKLFALDSELDIPEGSTKTELEQAMEGHILEKAELIGLYERVL